MTNEEAVVNTTAGTIVIDLASGSAAKNRLVLSVV
jgi:hypothetical protein